MEALIPMESAAVQRPTCKLSLWGPADEIGAVNRITPASVLATASDDTQSYRNLTIGPKRSSDQGELKRGTII